MTPAAATLSNPAAAGVKFLRRNCKTLPPPGVKCGRHIQNKSFKEKKERKDSNGNPIGYLNGLNLNSDLVDKDKWTVDLIKARTDKLVKEILEMFKL